MSVFVYCKYHFTLLFYFSILDCGKPNANVERPLISYGTKTEIGEYPWHAGLYLRIKGVWEHACGGTIISPYIILTGIFITNSFEELYEYNVVRIND